MRQFLFIFIFILPLNGLAITLQVQKILPSIFSEFTGYIASQNIKVDTESKAIPTLKNAFLTWAATSGYVIPENEKLEIRLGEINPAQDIYFYELTIKEYKHKTINKITLRYEDFNPNDPLRIKLPDFPYLGISFNPTSIDEKLTEYRNELTSAGFVYARVKSTTEVISKTTVDIKVILYLGKRYIFKFENNRFLPSSLLKEETIKRHQPGFKEAELSQLIKGIYIENGFRNVTISDSQLIDVPEEKTEYISIKVLEGPQFHVATPIFIFRNNQENAVVNRVHSEFLNSDPKYRYYSEKNSEAFTLQFIELMKNHGYYQSQIIAKQPRIHVDHYWITPVYDVVVGPQAILETVNLKPEMISEIGEKVFKSHKNKAFGKVVIQNALNSIKNHLIQTGYLDVTQELTVHRNFDFQKPNTILITLEILHTLGPKYIFKSHTYQNTCGTNPWLLDQYLELVPGEPYSPKILETSVANLYRSELFRSINIEKTDRNNGDSIERSINFHFFCGIRGNHEFGAGFFSETGFKLFSNFSYRNLFHGNQTIFVNSDLNIRLPPSFNYVEPHLGISLLWPYLFKWPFDARISTDFQIVDELDLDTTTGILTFDFEKWLKDWFKLTLHVFEFSLEYQHHFVDEPEKTEFTRLGKVGLTTEFSFVNHLHTPTRGHRHTLSGHLAGPQFGSTQNVNFAIGESSHALYISPFSSDRIVIAGNAVLGLMQSLFESNYIPRSEFFYLGGDASLRGFDIRSVGVSSKADAKTIQSMATTNFRSELRLKTFENLYLFGFWDTGSIWANFEKISDFRHSAGGGIRWSTPLGGVNFTIGFPIDDGGDPPNLVPGRKFATFKIHLSLSSF
jgi:outer membrane protein insertion porin family